MTIRGLALVITGCDLQLLTLSHFKSGLLHHATHQEHPGSVPGGVTAGGRPGLRLPSSVRSECLPLSYLQGADIAFYHDIPLPTAVTTLHMEDPSRYIGYSPLQEATAGDVGSSTSLNLACKCAFVCCALTNLSVTSP